MRFTPSASLSVASLSLLATLTGCGNTSPSPTPTGDASADTSTSDVSTTTDTSSGDSSSTDASTDTTSTTDAATDSPSGTDVMMTGDAAQPGQCGVGAGVAAYVTESATMAWAAVNRSRSMMMYGCAGASSPAGCLSDLPLADDTNIGGNRSAIMGAHLRVLFTSSARSTYWTRSSADGRFIARGTKVYDMVNRTEISATGADYDPAFFPDNSGFMYQPGGRLCPMSLLTTGMPTSITVTSSACAASSIGLYEHLAVSLGGEDYWASAAGTAAWDDGGRTATYQETRRNQAWTDTATMQLALMANTGSGYRYLGARNVPTPFQGDAVLSPSTRSVMTRFVDADGVYQGFVLHRLNATHTGSAITAQLTEIARYCTVGAKPAFSYDERYVVYHHYVGRGPAADADARDMGFADAADPGFAEYASRGAANLYLLDLLTGTRTRITNMGPGQYALFPHFRSDGWIYFLVRTPAAAREFAIASDAALVMR